MTRRANLSSGSCPYTIVYSWLIIYNTYIIVIFLFCYTMSLLHDLWLPKPDSWWRMMNAAEKTALRDVLQHQKNGNCFKTVLYTLLCISVLSYGTCKLYKEHNKQKKDDYRESPSMKT